MSVPQATGPAVPSVGVGETVIAPEAKAEAKASHAERLAAARAAERAALVAGGDLPAEEPKVAEEELPKATKVDLKEPEKVDEEPKEEASPADARAKRIADFLAKKSEKGEIAALRAQMAQQAEAFKAQMEAARLEERRALLEQMQKAPKELFQTHGVKADELLASAMEEATMDPVKLLERKYAALEAKLQAEAQERARLQQSLQEREQQATIQQQQQLALQTVLDQKRFPALHARFEGEPQTLLSHMSQVAEEYHARVGAWPSYEEVAEYIDSRESQIFARYSGSAQGSAPGAKRVPAKIGSSISVRDASQRVTPEEPKATTHKERLARARAAEQALLREHGRR